MKMVGFKPGDLCEKMNCSASDTDSLDSALFCPNQGQDYSDICLWFINRDGRAGGAGALAPPPPKKNFPEKMET